MNLLITVMENNGLQLELIAVTSLRFMLRHPLSWFYLDSNGCKQFDILINVFNLFSINPGYMISTRCHIDVTSGGDHVARVDTE